MARKCPFCSTSMNRRTIDAVELDLCPNCGGVWFDENELMNVLQRDPAAMGEIERLAVADVRQSHEGPSKLLCPDDEILLDRYRYLGDSPIILHACSKCCGLLVADGDLASMEQWRSRAHRPSTGSEKAAEILAQATIQHDTEMARHRNLQTLYNMLNQHLPGWIGTV